jgi:hypothetical protein
MLLYKKHLLFSITLLLSLTVLSQQAKKPVDGIEKSFLNPPASAKPWVIWYWMHGAVSKEGITADLEAMKEVGISGAYLMTIKDTNSKIPFQPQVRQLSPEWWGMIKFALQEAKRRKLQIGVHVSDGFALAGGPWIKPEMSMQKLVWTKTAVVAGAKEAIILAQPETKENYYRDIAVYAYPANYKNEITSNQLKPVITTSNGSDASFLTDISAKQTFRSDSTCWIQYTYKQPVTIRQVKIKKQNNAYQAQRFIIQKSDDGNYFIPVDTLLPPRHGWQDWDEAYTHAIKTFTSKYIRFVWQKEGTEPGSEDLDAAKWRPVLRVQGIYPSDEPVIDNYEAKNGSIWRVAAATTTEEVHKEDAVPLKNIINLSSKLAADGKLNWVPPAGTDWVIVRVGHTSTGHTNATGGGGRGLECDKFSTEATTLQFDNWFGKFYTATDPVLAREVIKVFHIDSWECGSQNWSKNFAAEFKKRRGYDLLPYLLVMTGTPVTNAATSEKILQDVRQTIAELVNDKFYVTLKNLAHAKGCQFSAESIAPTFVSDGLLHYKHADIPMGEFWHNSPTHDKPNDMLDAISGAHIYGKNIVAAEAFTTLRSDWGEHPGSLKALGDRAFASGINKLALHVFMHNPWVDKKPGITLDGIGLFYQRDQTWFKQSKVWIDYLARCQALLQLGKPVVDIAVFTGEEIPRRSVLPDRLVSTLPGIFGKEKVEAERLRLQNEGQPMRTIPDGVSHSANMADPENYIDALNGYQYDCFNPDVLMQMTVKNGKVITVAGASYAVLVIPGKHPMNPDAKMSDAVRNKLKQLAGAGAKIIVDTKLYKLQEKNFITAPYTESSFEKLGVKKDVELINGKNRIAWTHRRIGNSDIYFVSNQQGTEQLLDFSFGLSGKKPEIIDPVTNDISESLGWSAEKGRTYIQERVAPYQSLFVVFRDNAGQYKPGIRRARKRSIIDLNKNWVIQFIEPVSDSTFTIAADSLWDFTKGADPRIRYFSGTALYTNTFFVNQKSTPRQCIARFDSLHNLATISVNGIDCGTLWTAPFEIDISKAVRPGSNTIEIRVTNTWRNRLIKDELNPEKRTTWFNSPYQVKNKSLLSAGITGSINISYFND